jgi:hypothetical protein
MSPDFLGSYEDRWLKISLKLCVFLENQEKLLF